MLHHDKKKTTNIIGYITYTVAMNMIRIEVISRFAKGRKKGRTLFRRKMVSLRFIAIQSFYITSIIPSLNSHFQYVRICLYAELLFFFYTFRYELNGINCPEGQASCR